MIATIQKRSTFFKLCGAIPLSLLTMSLVAGTGIALDNKAYEDNKLNVRDCDGNKVSARWYEGRFTLSGAGAAPGEPQATIRVENWHGGCVTLGWDEKTASFILGNEDRAQRANHVPFIAWDGSKWIANRSGGGFFLARLADQNENVADAHVGSAIHRLQKIYPGNISAEALVVSLTDLKKSVNDEAPQ